VVIYDKHIVSRLDEIEARYIQKSLVVTQKTWKLRPLRLRLLDRITRLTAALQ
jgi:hypothetical protein